MINFFKNKKGVNLEINGNKRILEEVQMQRDNLAVINSLLGLSLEEIPINELFKKAIDLIISVSWLSLEPRGIIYLIDEGKPDTLVMKAQVGITDAMQKTCGRIPLGRCLCGEAALTKEIQFADRVDERHVNSYEGIYPHGHYCVPILTEGTIIGVLNVYLKEGHKYDTRETDFLRAISDCLAGVILRRRMEEQASKANEFKNIVFDSMHDAVSVIDVRDFRILDANKVFLNLVEKTKEEVIGKTCYEVTHGRSSPCSPPQDICPLMDTLNTNGTSFAEHIHSASSGKKIYVEVSTAPIKNREGEIVSVIHVARNITDRKQKENELQAAYEKLKNAETQLAQAAKMAGIGQLAAGVAHEINNPLTGVLNNVQFIKEELEKRKEFGKDEFKEILGVIEESALRCKKTVRALLDFSRASRGPLQFISLNDVIEKVVSLRGHELGSQNILFKKELQPDLPPILGDSQLLQQIVFDMISNAQWSIAQKSEKTGGLISIKTQYETDTERVCMFISDTGIGIPEENISRIFEPFFTTKPQGEGTGLGLCMAYNIIKKHNGTIEVESQANKGATFKISLPCVSKETA